MVGASGWEQIQGPRCRLVEAEGGAGRAGFSGLIRVGTRRHTRQPSPQPLPGSGRMGGTRVLLVWGDGIQLVALVAQMYWFVVQLVRLRKPAGRTLRFCLFKRCTARVRVAALTLKSHDSEVCAAEQRCACRWSHLVHLLLITVSVQGDECRNTPRGLLTHTAPPGSDGGPVMCYCLGGKRSYDLLTAKVSLRKTKQQDLSL